MLVKWTNSALLNLEKIQEFIAQDSPYHAYSFSEKLIQTTENLSSFPQMGRKIPETVQPEKDIRELLYHSYRILYQIEPEAIYILGVIHGSQNILGKDIPSI